MLGEEETVGVSLGRKEVADRLSVKWLSEAVKAGGLREGLRVAKGTGCGINLVSFRSEPGS